MVMNATTQAAGNALFERIQAHLAKGGAIQIATALRAWEFRSKHAAMLRSGKDGERGIYMQRGRAWDYIIDESYVRFSKLEGR